MRKVLPEFVDQSFYVYAGTYGGQHFCMIDSQYIENEIQQAIAQGVTKILFDNINEAVYFDIIRKIHRIVRSINNPSVEYYYLSSAQNGKRAYTQYCLKNNITPVLNILSVSFFEQHQKETLTHFSARNPTIKPTYQVKLKSKLFCCFNKMLRPHRIQIFYNILKHGLLDKTYSSFQYGKKIISELTDPTQIEIRREFRKHKHIFPLTLNMTLDRQNPVDVWEGDFLYHQESYFSLVTETLFFKDAFDAGISVFLTEKTFRPLIHKHPFILVAPATSLAYLRKLGYKTFAPYIDESYDDIKNDEDRLSAIWKEVERLCAFTDDQWIEWQKNVAEIVEHNYNVIMNKNNYILNNG